MKHQKLESKRSETVAADFNEHIALLAILVCLVISLPSCKTTQQAVSPPAGCEESILYKNLQAARVVDAALVIGISVAATNHPETKPYLEKAVDALSEMLDDNQVTYVEFLEAAVTNVKWLNSYCGTALLAVSPVMAEFDRPIPINACDTRLLKEHLAREKAVLANIGT